MVLKEIWGSYMPNQVLGAGSFQLGNPPTVLRDGTNVASAKKMFTATHVSTGLYEVDWIAGFPLPRLPFIVPFIEQAAPATTPCNVRVVKGTWDPTTGNRKFRLCVETVGTSPAVSDADAGDRIGFIFIGGWEGPSVDPA